MKEEQKKALEKYKKKEPEKKVKKQKEDKKKRDPNFFDKLSKNKNEFKEEQEKSEGKDSLDVNFKHQEPEKLYRLIKKQEHESEAKKLVIKALTKHRDQHFNEFKQTPSILQQG